jgi:protein SERAC1
MGTPHEGSWMADWANISARCLGVIKSANTRLLDTLGQNDEMLKAVQEEFCTMIGKPRPNGRDIEMMCFFEELGFPVVGYVVPKESATLRGYHYSSIHANHRDMVKFASREDAGFKDVRGELVRWEKEINEEIAKDLAEQQRQQQQQQPPPSPPDEGNKRQGNTSSSPSMEQGQSGHYHTGNNYNSGSGQQIQLAHFHGDMRFWGKSRP